jgi:acetyl esterase/lipase
LDAHQNKRERENMWRTTFVMARAVALTFVMAPCSYPQTLKIWPGIAPGSETWTQEERVEKNTPIGTVVFNVVTPALTVYLPERTKATGTGIIIAPGGAFVALAIDLEGHDVARWLQDKGIAAFVLKYRIMEKRQEGIPAMNMDEAGKYGIADGIQALKVVRQHAAEWGISPDRGRLYGFLGRRHGYERSSAPTGCRRTSEFCGAYLWWTVRSDASHSGSTAAHFPGMGTGRRLGPQRCG